MIKAKPTIAFYTFGCRLNQSETLAIERTFESDGFRVVNATDPADIFVVNTCTVTENGDADARRFVQKVSKINPHARIALVGCQAQMQKDKLADWPNVRWVVGNAKKMDLLNIIKDEASATVIAPTMPRDSFTLPITEVTGIKDQNIRANLKIQDGCDFFCSFCEIPYARGRARSRQFSDILKEATMLVDAGHQEIVLTGINIGTYADGRYRFEDVISALEQISKLQRIRISSIEPTTIPCWLIERMGKGSKICRHLHIPLQSADDEILSLMKRKYAYAEFKDFVDFAEASIPGLCLGTDVIVGFPGETDQHFQRTYDRLLHELPIDYIHAFSYSERTMNKSNNLPDPIPSAIIKQRSEMMRELSLRKRQVFNHNLLNTPQRVLFEIKKRGEWTGLTDHYVRVFATSEENLRNQFREVRINTAREFCRGEIIK